jgi:hypothetical protein
MSSNADIVVLRCPCKIQECQGPRSVFRPTEAARGILGNAYNRSGDCTHGQYSLIEGLTRCMVRSSAIEGITEEIGEMLDLTALYDANSRVAGTCQPNCPHEQMEAYKNLNYAHFAARFFADVLPRAANREGDLARRRHTASLVVRPS